MMVYLLWFIPIAVILWQAWSLYSTRRWMREMEANERIECARMYTEYYTVAWPKLMWEIYNTEPIWKKHLKQGEIFNG